MKNEDETVAAFEVLWRNAETDFEKHRIKSLLTDLAYGEPKVEVIDDTHQKFKGKIYSNSNNNRHYRNTSSLHKDIFEYCYGEVPENYIVHHVDINPENNSIENLKAMTLEEHTSLHRSLVPKKEYVCQGCGKTFLASSNQDVRFCCQYCKVKWRRKNGIDYEKRTCLRCGKEYSTRKDSSQKYCSSACAAIANFRKPREIRHCTYCGKTFETKITSTQKFCSTKCASKFREQEKRK